MGKVKILKASAGSGKTFMLAYEYVKSVVRHPHIYRNILAVTFTKKATGEMKSRILDELYNLTIEDGKRHFLDMLLSEEWAVDEQIIRANAQKALDLILNDYSSFSVMTIDSFFQKIVRSFIKELHLESDYSIDFNTDYLLRLSIDNLVHRSDKEPKLKEWILSIIDSKLDSAKKADVKRQILPFSHKILNEEFDKSYFENHTDELILFFNELEKIREELIGVVRGYGESFISYCNKNTILLEQLPGKSRGVFSYMNKIANGDISLPSKTVIGYIEDDGKWKTTPQEHVSPLKELLSKLYHYLIENNKGINTLNALLTTHHAFVLLGDISNELNEICKSSNKMILSNTDHLINKLVKNNDIPYIYEKVGSIYTVIMIDEFQDTSMGQWQNFVPLLENIVSISPSDDTPITLVGDIKQSIYRWRGGDWRILGEKVSEQFGSDNIVEYNLSTNYRSREVVIDFNNRAIRHCADEINLYINGVLDDFRDSKELSLELSSRYNNLLQSAYDGMEQMTPSNPKSGGYVEVSRYENDENLAKIIDIIKDAQDRGFQAKDIAILVRGNAAAADIVSYILDYKSRNEEECKGYNLDIVSSGGVLLNSSPVIRFIISVYILAIDVNDMTLAYYNQYRELPIKQPLTPDEEQFINSLHTLPISTSVEHIINRYGLGEQAESVAYLQALHTATINYTANERGDISSFIEWWESEKVRLAVKVPEGQNAITIDTIHKSKGLQYGVVIIPYNKWDLKPMSGKNTFWAMSDDDNFRLPGSTKQKVMLSYNDKLADSHYMGAYLHEMFMTMIESFNLLYVAYTRAEDELYIMLPLKETTKGIDRYLNSFIGENYIFGDKIHKSDSAKISRGISFDKFNFQDISERVVVHTESDKFFKDAEAEDATIDERGRGIILHSLFESVLCLEDFETNIDKMYNGGFISENEMRGLKIQVNTALERDDVRSWFDGTYKVISERGIILPDDRSGVVSMLRPDRVLIGDGKAIVVDYKFGEQRKSHNKQIERYKAVLKRMGYGEIYGYLWYIRDNKVVEL